MTEEQQQAVRELEQAEAALNTARQNAKDALADVIALADFRVGDKVRLVEQLGAYESGTIMYVHKVEWLARRGGYSYELSRQKKDGTKHPNSACRWIEPDDFERVTE